MKMQITLLLVVALLFVGGVALRQTQSSALAQLNEPQALAGYAIKPGTVSGGLYRLTNVSWQADNTASGGEYRLLGLHSPSGGTPCCCVYLPCTLGGN